MRELRLVDTTAEALVLAVASPAPDTGEDLATAPAPEATFRLPLTDEVRDALAALVAPTAAVPTPPEEPETPAAAPVVTAVAPSPDTAAVDPRVHLSPKEIQHRIRAGASVADLVRESGMVEARIDVFAHPILQERQHIARLAHLAHPLGAHGPVRETLYEVLANAFASRGWRLNEADWDAYRPGMSSRWLVSLTWPTGHTEATAVWTFDSDGAGSATVTPTNELAADLIDPGFTKPVRTLSPVSRGVGLFDVDAQDVDEFDTTTSAATVSPLPQRSPAAATPLPPAEDDFLRHPEPPRKPKRRKPIPGWEDVLLGVRGTKK